VCRLVVVGVGAVVADFRVRQDNDLPGIRRIGENFLIAGNGGIKNDFAVTLAFCSVASFALPGVDFTNSIISGG
jgi:hypothetical protein